MIKHLILLQNQKVALFRIHNNEMEPILKEGEKIFALKEDFWEWWQDAAEYMQGDPVDICFVFDKPHPLIQESAFYTPLNEQSQWTQENILEVFDFIGLGKVQLFQADCAESKEDLENVFFTNITLNAPKIIHPFTQETPKSVRNKAQETEAQRFYRELQEKEEQERREKQK